MSEQTTNAASPAMESLNAAPAPVETPAAPIEAPKVPETDPDLSRRFAALAKQEKRINEQKRSNDEASKKYAKLEKLLQNPKEDPMSLLKEAGLTMDDVIRYQLKAGQPPTAEDRVLTVEEKLAKFERERDEEREAAKQQTLNREIQAFKDTIKSSIDKDLAKYELIHANDDYDLVYDTCVQAIRENPEAYQTRADVESKLLPKVLDLIEAERFEKMKKLTSLGKVKSLFGEVPKAPEGGQLDKTPQAKDSIAPPTLTNKQAPSTPTGSGRLLSREESLKKAAQLLKWT